jgi:hypothetical protein
MLLLLFFFFLVSSLPNRFRFLHFCHSFLKRGKKILFAPGLTDYSQQRCCLKMEFQSVDEAHMEELVASEIPAAQRVIVVGAERPYLACLIFLKAFRNSENLDADVISIASVALRTLS